MAKEKKQLTPQQAYKKTFNESVVDFSQVKSYNLKNSNISLGSRCLNNIVTGNTEIGVVDGRIIEIYGLEGSGKTTIVLEATANCQKKKGTVMFIDAEHSLNIDYAKKIGVKFEDLLFSQPNNGEEAFEMVLWGVKNNLDLVVVDSVASMVPIAEIEADMDQDFMGAHARLMGKGLRKLVANLKIQTKTSVVFINQIRMKIGVTFGNPEVQPGGRALKFYSDVRVEIRDPREGKIVNDSIEIGKFITAKTVKNKMYPPYKKTLIPIIYGEGIDKKRDIIQLLTEKGLAEASKSGKSVTIQGYKKTNFTTFSKRLDTDTNFRKKIRGMIK